MDSQPNDRDSYQPIPEDRALVPVSEQLPDTVVEQLPAAAEKRGRGRPKKEQPTQPEGSNSAAIAKRYIDRLTTLLQEKQELSAQIAEVKADAKSQGFIPAVLQRLAMRELETADARAVREAEEEEMDRLLVALGQLSDTPLGQAARAA